MPEIKYANIDETKDLKEFFEFICANVLEKTTLVVKRDLLKWQGKDNELMKKHVTFNDLFILFDKIDMPFKLTIRYAVPEVSNTTLPEPPPQNPVAKELEKQEKEMATIVSPPIIEKLSESAGTKIKEQDDTDALFAK